MTKGLIVVAGAMIASAVANAQGVPEGPSTFQFVTASGPLMFTYSTLGSSVVTGRPFSATEERKSSQTLGDGTHIETTETNRIFRDEEGRTRTERKDGGISIYDPIAGFRAELNPSTKTASKTMVLRLALDAKGRQFADLQKQLAEREKQYSENSPEVKDLQNQLEKITAEQRALPQVKTAIAEPAEYRPRIAEAGQSTSGEPGSERRVAYSLTTADGPTILRVDAGNNGSVESLAPQMINGILSQGTRTTETIPIGKIGNDRPINVVSERWYSNDLQMLIRSTSSDPRFGDSTYQLTNIVQTSPDPSLFQIPGDYTIRK
ncbi:MAG TPA: hypothetical protein VHC90_04090 [Bryobacteraceae bacterium]|nr:hypothetical protein [Bryobacteraceae bacterium]